MMKKIFALLILVVLLCPLDISAENLWNQLRNRAMQLECWYRKDGVKHTYPDQILTFKKVRLSDLQDSLKNSPEDEEIDILVWLNCEDGNHLDWVETDDSNKVVYQYRILDAKDCEGWMKVLTISGNKVTTLDNIGIYRDYIIL